MSAETLGVLGVGFMGGVGAALTILAVVYLVALIEDRRKKPK